MNFLIFLGLFVCVIALVVTLMLTRADGSNYESGKSIANLSFIYIVIIPIVAIVIVLLFWIFV
ncbi:hypothetical protein [Halalkalibacterium ligniniphilum]|uniref:hypothetical protein n=1 Tax=Halalkalibacterium ligniniphilum TaxID=1134413 RepID=UPI000344996C|nr:hypothetical protein [Halalkalibacterium ligniniphilum]